MIRLPDTRREDLDENKKNHRPRTNQIMKLHPLKSKTGKGKSSRKTSGNKVQEKKVEKDSSSSDELPDVPF